MVFFITAVETLRYKLSSGQCYHENSTALFFLPTRQTRIVWPVRGTSASENLRKPETDIGLFGADWALTGLE